VSKVLVIDDDMMVCRTLARIIEKTGHEATSVHSLSEGIQAVSSEPYDVVFLDVRLPDGNGLDALPSLQSAPSSPEVIIITGQGDPDGAELAVKSGAWAYIQKPLSLENMKLQLSRALQYRKEKAHTRQPITLKREKIIGSSPAMQACLDLVAQVASGDISVLITGETGTGKELIAETIHKNSSRAAGPFVVVDCAALTETLAESILFGHEKGAFTGADKPRVGLIKEADGGTLFLDEVGELPPIVQKDFLRALQEREFRPLGNKKEVRSDFRLVSATHRNLEKMVQGGEFRKDIFFRIQSVTIELPPLRARSQDIKELAVHFMMSFCERYGTETKGFSPDFFSALTAYDWPGNVRELMQAMERALTVARLEPTFYPRHLPTRIQVHAARASLKADVRSPRKPASDKNLPVHALPSLQDFREEAVARAETQYLRDLMRIANKDIKEACAISGLSRSRLYSLLQKYGITRA
jgi:two-component system NtrC family response regulator